jgi:plastocyanin
MKNLIIVLCILSSSLASSATIHVVNVWDGYFQFVDAVNFSPNITIQLGDTVQWLPLDIPTMVHTITSTNIPTEAESFDQIWQAPADTFFQYVPLFIGLYEYECTPHAKQYGMIGSIDVLGVPTGIDGGDLSETDLLVYPNPSTDFIRFNNSNVVYGFNVFSSSGNLVLYGKTDELVNTSTLEDGIYHIQILGDRQHILKFLKQ